MRYVIAFIPIVAAVLLGYPAAAFSVHGLQTSVWPEDVVRPSEWYAKIAATYGGELIQTYGLMLTHQSPAFIDGGWLEAMWTFSPALLLSVLLSSAKPLGPRRAPTPVYGDARFATASERRRMKAGVEIGLDPNNGRTVRVAVQGNLISVAPLGSGKSSGLLLPNLAAPEASAWFGPAVIIDPKGDAYRAVGERRRALGRSVYCLDPMAIAGGEDRWNPFDTLDPNNIIQLQATAAALLPAPGANETKYFREAANAIIVAAFLAVHREVKPSPSRVAELLADQTAFAAALKGIDAVAARSTLALIENPPRNLMDLFSTAQQALRWCEDPRLATMTSDSTIRLAAICRGDADLFLTLPTETMERLAPLIRWLLNELFTTVRRDKPRERLLIFVDEAKLLGPSAEIATAYGELPGYNVSLWTYWQSRAQIVETYGEHGAGSLIANSEIITFSDPPRADPDTLDHWSRALGDFMMVEETRTVTEATKDKAGSVSTGTTMRAAPLMSRDALGSLPATDLIAIVNGQRHVRHPLMLRKTRYDDPRLRGLVEDLGGRADAE